MQDCDRVLGRMEEMLQGFQADLGEISSEIRHLQEDSMSMSVKLKNRRAVADRLHAFLEKTNLPPAVLNNIISPTVNEGFLEAVIILGKRLTYLEQQQPATDGSSLDIAPSDTAAGRGLLPELEKLKIKAIGKIRDYFSTQFNAIRKPKTNIYMLQQTSLVRYSPLFHFLNREQNAVAEDLRSLYVESMGRTVQNLFKSYYAQMLKLEVAAATKTDLLFVEEQTLRSLFTQKVDMNKRSDVFALGDRAKVLDSIESEPILLHVALAENRKLHYEEILRSLLKHLVDAATSEFLFIVEFFRSSPKDTFNRIYGRCIATVLESVENYLLACYDAVGILIMLRLVHLLRLIMQRRRIPCLDPLFDRLSLLLWPRFKQLLDVNLRSLKAANQTVGRRSSVGIGGGSSVDLSPQLVCRRYAEFVSSILLLHFNHAGKASAGGGDDMNTSADNVLSSAGEDMGSAAAGVMSGELMLQQDIALLRTELIALMDRTAVSIATSSSARDQRVFLINNYDLILSIFQERQLLSEEVSRFEQLLLTQRELFAEEEIKAFFPRLLVFIAQAEQALQEGPAAITGIITESACETLVRDFSANWRPGIQSINDEVLRYFANFRSGMEILKQVLTQLLLYYTRFQDIVKRVFSRPPPFTREIISTATILMEIKRYSRSF